MNYDDFELLEDLSEWGCYIQTNIGSIGSGMFDFRRKLFMKLAKNGMIDFLGTDCHSVNSRSADVKKELGKIRKILGEEEFYIIVSENPDAIINSVAE